MNQQVWKLLVVIIQQYGKGSKDWDDTRSRAIKDEHKLVTNKEKAKSSDGSKGLQSKDKSSSKRVKIVDQQGVPHMSFKRRTWA